MGSWPGAAIALLVVLGGCGTSPVARTDVPGEVLCEFRQARIGAVETRAAVEQAVAELRGASWLAAPDLRAGPVASAERRVLVDTTYRITLDLLAGERRRPARLWIERDARGAHRLAVVDLGPVGDDAPLADPPEPTAAPGGWSAQPTADAAVSGWAETARGLMAREAWLGRPVSIVGVVGAMTQVVAGLNIYLALDARIAGGDPRRVLAIVHEPLAGTADLTWLRLFAPAAHAAWPDLAGPGAMRATSSSAGCPAP